ncbi:MAG: zinc metallopeptidase [Bacteroidia bacterium]|nr:zinc metallopeptidase [Bacteroidia bacterium]
MIFGILLMAIIGIASWAVSNQLKSKFEEYSHEPIALTGAEIAERMLRDNNITDVKVISVEGQLTDHYNPENKTVNLSSVVYNQRNVAAAAVAAHECGHAVQHATAYSWLTMRSKIVPIVSVASTWLQYVLMAGILLVAVFPPLLVIGIVLFALTTLFSFITLPVEFDASQRGLAWLQSSGVVAGIGYDKAKDALKWAALTYVVAALASLITLLHYISIFMRRR